MEQLQGFRSEAHLDHVYKLKKALYGLTQAPWAWFGKVVEFLTQCGYSMAQSDPSLFMKDQNKRLAVMLVYVDNLIITRNDQKEIN